MLARRPLHLLLATAASCVLVSASAASAAVPSCGSTLIKKSTGAYWACTFGDDFDGTTLDRTKWTPMTTATAGFTHVGECYVDDPQHISVAGGYLTLTATKLAKPASCGWFSTQYQTGMVFTEDKFAQTYGRFEARVKWPKGVGFASGFWMWPNDMAYGAKSGEIDVAEYYGAYPDYVLPHTHIKDGSRDRGSGTYCRVTDPSGGFHTYAVEWLPTGIKFLYDGVTCMTITKWDPGAPMVFPQPFDKSFFMALTLSLGYAENYPTAASIFPAKMQVDYVRAWK